MRTSRAQTPASRVKIAQLRWDIKATVKMAVVITKSVHIHADQLMIVSPPLVELQETTPAVIAAVRLNYTQRKARVREDAKGNLKEPKRFEELLPSDTHSREL